MPRSGISESDIRDAASEWLKSLGWNTARGPDIAPDTPGAERADYVAAVLEGRLRETLVRLSPGLSATALNDAFRKLTCPAGATILRPGWGSGRTTRKT